MVWGCLSEHERRHADQIEVIDRDPMPYPTLGTGHASLWSTSIRIGGGAQREDQILLSWYGNGWRLKTTWSVSLRKHSGSQLSWISGDANHTQDLRVDATTGAVGRRYSDPYGNSRDASPSPWASDHGYLNAPTSAATRLTLERPRLRRRPCGAGRSAAGIRTSRNSVTARSPTED